MDVGGDGLYWFKTEMPGDESAAGWGADNKPHIHYHLTCDQCDTDLFSGKFEYWNKFYPMDVCTLDACAPAGTAHHAEKLRDGVYLYHMVIASDEAA
jgi:hypothetical protein